MKREEAIKARDQLVRQLPDASEMVRGSLLHRQIFHRRGCPKCRRGVGHRVWVLTVSYPGGRTRQFSIRSEQKPQVEKWLESYQQLRAKAIMSPFVLSPIVPRESTAASRPEPVLFRMRSKQEESRYHSVS